MELAPVHVTLDDSLPSYSRRQHGHIRRHSALPQSRSIDTPEPVRRQTEHVFTLSSPSHASLTLKSSAKSSKSLPTYFEKESIVGEFEVDLDRGGSVVAITAVVRILSLGTKAPSNIPSDYWKNHDRFERFRISKRRIPSMDSH